MAHKLFVAAVVVALLVSMMIPHCVTKNFTSCVGKIYAPNHGSRIACLMEACGFSHDVDAAQTRATLAFGPIIGVRSLSQVGSDLATIVRDGLTRRRFQLGLSTFGMFQPSLSIPAYLGYAPTDRRLRVFNHFDTVGASAHFSQRVSRDTCRDYKGSRNCYDEHDGTDFVCPIGTKLVAAAPGIVVMIRDNWLRGGLTIAVDHDNGIVTQYTHCSASLVSVGDAVLRGEAVAISGVAGIDMLSGFPWVPPHVHFMVFADGVPVDPFGGGVEACTRVRWWAGDEGRGDRCPCTTARPLPGDPPRSALRPSPVDADAARALASRVRSGTTVGTEIAVVLRSNGGDFGDPFLAHLLEEIQHHERWAVDGLQRPGSGSLVSVRGAEGGLAPVDLTLPLPATTYDGVRVG